MTIKFTGDIEELKTLVSDAELKGEWMVEGDKSHRFSCKNGGIIKWWETTGTISVQGKSPGKESIKALLEAKLDVADGEIIGNEKKMQRIFVVHGHDKDSRTHLELMLHRLGLNPYVLMNEAGQGETLIEELEKHIGKEGEAAFGIVVMTPDDVGYAKTEGPDKKRDRARQNVVLEMGMLISSLTRKNVAILKHISVEQPSDAAGIKYIPFEKEIRECGPQLIQRLQNAEIEIDPEKIAKF